MLKDLHIPSATERAFQNSKFRPRNYVYLRQIHNGASSNEKADIETVPKRVTRAFNFRFLEPSEFNRWTTEKNCSRCACRVEWCTRAWFAIEIFVKCSCLKTGSSSSMIIMHGTRNDRARFVWAPIHKDQHRHCIIVPLHPRWMSRMRLSLASGALILTISCVVHLTLRSLVSIWQTNSNRNVCSICGWQQPKHVTTKVLWIFLSTGFFVWWHFTLTFFEMKQWILLDQI